MKTCVLICGIIPNNFHKYYDSINKTLIEPYNSDVFISTWKSNLNDDVFRLYKPKLYRIESLDDISIKSRLNDFLYFLKEKDNCGNRTISLNGRYTMFYKIYDVNCLRNEYENYKNIKYDLIIRCRFDLDFGCKHQACVRGPFVYNHILKNEIEEVLNNDNIIYLRHDFSDIKAVWDQFAFGGNFSMNIYFNTFLNLEKIIENYYLTSEEILYRNLINNGIIIRHTNTTYDIKTYDR